MLAEVSKWLKISFLCSELHCLPSAGGLYDQDEHDLNRLEKVLQARNQWFKDDSNNKQSKSESEERVKRQIGT